MHEVDPGKFGRFNADNLSDDSDWQGKNVSHDKNDTDDRDLNDRQGGGAG